LAYSREKSLCIVKDSPTYGKHDESFIDSYFNSERINLAQGLTGAENMNFDYTDPKDNKAVTLEDKLMNSLRFLLSDCLLEAYMRAFDKQKCEQVVGDLANNGALHALVQIALLTTHDKLA